MDDLDTLYQDYAILLVEWALHVNKDPNSKVKVCVWTEEPRVWHRADIGDGQKKYVKMDRRSIETQLKKSIRPAGKEKEYTRLWQLISPIDDYVSRENLPNAESTFESLRQSLNERQNVPAVLYMPRKKYQTMIEWAANRICGQIVALHGRKVWGEGKLRLPRSVKCCHDIASQLRDLEVNGEGIEGIDSILDALPKDVQKMGVDEGKSKSGRRVARKPSESTDKRAFRKTKIPTAEHWYKITLKFVTDETVQISNRTEKKKFTYSELGFAKERDKRPFRRWEILLLFAEGEGEILKGNLPRRGLDAFNRQRQQLAADLKELFGIKKDPFECLDSYRGWKTQFHIERAEADSITRM